MKTKEIVVVAFISVFCALMLLLFGPHYLTKSPQKQTIKKPHDNREHYYGVDEIQLNSTSIEKKFLYLLQTESCIPGNLDSSKAIGNGSYCQCDVLVLSYKQKCRESTLDHVKYLFDPSSTWNVGRNLLYLTAMNRSKKYLYYIFMDDDIILKTDSKHNYNNNIVNPWRQFEFFLEEIEPAVGIVDINARRRLKLVYEARKRMGCTLGENADYLPIAHFDSAFNAFHYKAVQHILPYTIKFDNISWWFSGWYATIKSEIIFTGQSVVYTKLIAMNNQHRPYPRKMALNDETHHWPEILKEVTADLSGKYPKFNVNLILEWFKQGPSHTKRSSALCLPPPPPHMPIKPFAYLESTKR